MKGDGAATSFRALLLVKQLQSVLALHRLRSIDTSILTSIRVRGANLDQIIAAIQCRERGKARWQLLGFVC